MARLRIVQRLSVVLFLPVFLIPIALSGSAGKTGLPIEGDENPLSGCAAPSCHSGIEDIRSPDSAMMREISSLGVRAGDSAGCVVCHGGNPQAATKEAAHSGSPFSLQEAGGPQNYIPDPGSPWVNDRTCGLCHADLVKAQWTSLMMTEAGKIQGVAWAFGSLEGYEHKWGNYDAVNPLDPEERRGTKEYRQYMEALKVKEPGVYPEAMTAVPEAPVDLADLADHPEKSAFTYIRSECQRCHLGVRGREKRGDYRGMGCSACHIPYSNEGLYEGGDESIPRDAPRHLLVHSIQATREAKVTIHETTYSGIPVETCTTCHDRGKRIGVSFQGLMESAYKSPFADGGEPQHALHSKHYIAMQEDIHYQKGMMCLDCHTSIDVHGDGFLCGSNLAQVQIECADCHGTPESYPWELPLGFGDEFGPTDQAGPPRGVARELPPGLKKGTVYPAEDGYLLTARGNPYPEVVRRGKLVIVHTAGGIDIELKPLKLLCQEEALDPAPRTAMKEIGSHIAKMECYTCHATWAPQCYGCHVKIDYSGEKKAFDWVAAGHSHKEALAEGAAEIPKGESGYGTMIPGEVEEQRSYLRYEDPPLVVNGEGRVSPAMPGCQVSVTIVGRKGETILKNHIFRTLPGKEGAGPEGQLGIDMSPAQPHTTGKGRACESCHLSEKALGYGIDGGRATRAWNEPVVIDLMTAAGQVLPRSARTQIEAVSGLEGDWSRFITEEGRQLQPVGHHISLSRPLNEQERAHIDRQGVCLSCHEEIPDESLAVGLLHHAAQFMGALPDTSEEHGSLLHKILLISAWGQVGGGVASGRLVLAAALWLWRRRRRSKIRQN